MNWNRYFEMMRDWKQLPAYRAEPRIDSLVGFYLRDIAAECLGEAMPGIIPELPIRLGTVKPRLERTKYANRSYKVDFYLLGASGRNYFVEFKTDSGSRRDKQDQYLAEAKEKGMKAIVGGIIRIAEVSSYNPKYDHLVKKLSGLGLIDAGGAFAGKGDEIEIVFVQPRCNAGDAPGRVIDFARISQWLSSHAHGDFETAFSQTLLQWSSD